MARLNLHTPPPIEALNANREQEPEGERIRAELIDWITRNKIVSVYLDTEQHCVEIGITKLPPLTYSVLTKWGSIFVEGEESRAVPTIQHLAASAETCAQCVAERWCSECHQPLGVDWKWCHRCKPGTLEMRVRPCSGCAAKMNDSATAVGIRYGLIRVEEIFAVLEKAGVTNPEGCAEKMAAGERAERLAQRDAAMTAAIPQMAGEDEP